MKQLAFTNPNYETTIELMANIRANNLEVREIRKRGDNNFCVLCEETIREPKVIELELKSHRESKFYCHKSCYDSAKKGRELN